jgi:hypothetical protein
VKKLLPATPAWSPANGPSHSALNPCAENRLHPSTTHCKLPGSQPCCNTTVRHLRIDVRSMWGRCRIEVGSIFSGFSMHSSTPKTKEHIRHDAKLDMVEQHNACSVGSRCAHSPLYLLLHLQTTEHSWNRSFHHGGRAPEEESRACVPFTARPSGACLHFLLLVSFLLFVQGLIRRWSLRPSSFPTLHHFIPSRLYDMGIFSCSGDHSFAMSSHVVA